MANVLFFLFPFLALPTFTNTVEIELYNIEDAKGSVRIAVFDSAKSFDDRAPFVYATAVAVNSTDNIKVQISGLTAGKKYCIAAYQDINGNEEMDTNLFGVPTEPYAFSNNPRVKWKAPVFEEMAFQPESAGELRLRLAHWSDR